MAAILSLKITSRQVEISLDTIRTNANMTAMNKQPANGPRTARVRLGAEEDSMKLSEAIRLGSMLKPQAFGIYFDAETGGACAIGAALLAMNSEAEDGGMEDQIFPIFMSKEMKIGPCPVCRKLSTDFGISECNTVAHLNDHHLWTREAIADWVETIEQQQEQIEANAALSGERSR